MTHKVHKADVRLGAVYAAKVSDRMVPLRIEAVSPYGGWDGINLQTHKQVRVRSAARLRYELERSSETGKWREAGGGRA